MKDLDRNDADNSNLGWNHFDELAEGLGDLPEFDFMDDGGLEKRIIRQINRRITKICLRTLAVVAASVAVLTLIVNPVMKRLYYDPRPMFSADDAAYSNEFARYMRVYYETGQPYVTVYDTKLKDKGFGRYTAEMEVVDTSSPIHVGLSPNVMVDIDWGRIEISDPKNLTVIMANRFGDGLMSEEDKDAFRKEVEALPDSSVIYLSLAAAKPKPVAEVAAGPVEVNWVEIYNDGGKLHGGLTIRKSIMEEGERDRTDMTNEELRQEYLSNLRYLLSQPQLLNALRLRGISMGAGGQFYSFSEAVEPLKELLDQMEKQDVLTTKNYCISGKKQEILDYLDSIDYTYIRADQVRLSILEH